MATQKLNRFSSGALVSKLRERNSTLTEADAKLAVARVFDAIEDLVDNEQDVRIKGFGTFSRKFVPSRNARNPQTGETIVTAEKHVIKFREGKRG